MYTLEGFEKAKAGLRRWVGRFDRYSGNNPNKYQSDIKAARRHVRTIEETLKAAGLVQVSDTDFIEKELDVAFPNAASKQVVEFKGRRFQRWFWPIEKSRSGTSVREWVIVVKSGPLYKPLRMAAMSPGFQNFALLRMSSVTRQVQSISCKMQL